MPEVISVTRSGRRMTVRFAGAPALTCDRDFPAARSFAAGQRVETRLLERLRAQVAGVEAQRVAVRLLAQRARSRAELRRSLRERALPEPAIAETLERLAERGRLDDAAYAQRWVEDRTQRRPRSARLLRAELDARGIDRETAAAATAAVDDDALALRLARGRTGDLRGDWRAFERRLGAMLLRRGFSMEVARRALHAAWDGGGPPATR